MSMTATDLVLQGIQMQAIVAPACSPTSEKSCDGSHLPPPPTAEFI